MTRLRIDIGIFAHDEAAGIAAMLRGIAAQDIFARHDVRALLLANGCRDATVPLARAVGGPVGVVDLPEGGKSRTWNVFVHELSRPEADLLIFCDADIRLPAADSLTRLAEALAAHPAALAFNSRPVKDIAEAPDGAQDRLIAAAGGTLDDWRSAICGQLYALRSPTARRLHLPIGLPVEDGFLRAMLLTDALTAPEDLSRIDGDPSIFHLYASERTIAGLLRHQTRIVIGSAINAAAFDRLRALPPAARQPELARAAKDEDWLAATIRARLPRWWGFVPPHFLTKRSARILRSPRDLRRPGRWVVLLAGAGFDAIVYVSAQIRMARGAGAGFW